MNTIIITGGAGFIGTLLTDALIKKGYRVVVLDRSPSRIQNTQVISHVCDLTTDDTLPIELFEGAFAIINLAGTPIFGRFIKKYKQSIYDSRIKTLENIYTTLTHVTHKPQKLISASAVGYYGKTNGNLAHEETIPGTDFLATVCVDWEAYALKYKELGLRVSIIRTANVIGKGGLFAVLKKLFKNYVGGYFGNGTQHMPWIAAPDLVNAYITLLENERDGIYNVSAGNITQKELMKNISKATYKTFVWRIPRIFGYILYGTFVDVLLMDIEVDNKKLLDSGFVLTEPDLFQYLRTLEKEA